MKYLVRYRPNPKGTTILRQSVEASSSIQAVEHVMIGLTMSSLVSVTLDDAADLAVTRALLEEVERKAIEDDTR